MNNNDQLPKMTFENLKKIEADVFSGRSRAEKHKSGGDGQVRDTWRLNQEVLDARREAAALKDELNAARTLIAEQNVFAVSSRSALREMQQELDLAKTETGRKEYGLADLNSEISRLRSAINLEKMRNADLRGKLAQEAGLRRDLEELLRESEKAEEALQQEIEALGRDLKASREAAPAYSKAARPTRFVRRFI